MKQNILLKNLLISAAAALALAVSARAGGLPEAAPEATTATTPVHQGLLGQQYAGLTYSYVDLQGPVNADNFQFAFNQPLNTGLDGVFAYDWTQAGLSNGLRENTQSLTAALRAFTTTAWAKPYVEAGAGYAWQRQTPAGRDTSFLWEAAVGAEFQVLPALTVTPYVQYTDAIDLADRHVWSGGVKANYWVDSQWAITAGVARDDNQNNKFTVGTNFRF
jgi:opacity protein-like surface antigen